MLRRVVYGGIQMARSAETGTGPFVIVVTDHDAPVTVVGTFDNQADAAGFGERMSGGFDDAMDFVVLDIKPRSAYPEGEEDFDWDAAVNAATGLESHK
jgi:hypothetical protein